MTDKETGVQKVMERKLSKCFHYTVQAQKVCWHGKHSLLTSCILDVEMAVFQPRELSN